MTKLIKQDVDGDEFDLKFVPSHQSSYESACIQSHEMFSDNDIGEEVGDSISDESEENKQPNTSVQITNTQQVRLDQEMINLNLRDKQKKISQTGRKPENSMQENSSSRDENEIDFILSEQFNTYTQEQLTQIFNQFQPLELSLETIYVPFLGNYEPSLGEPDCSIKIRRPDEKEDPLGLVVFDEPCIEESQPYLLLQKLQLLYEKLGIQTTSDVDTTESIQTLKNDKDMGKNIDKFLQNIENLRKQQGTYNRNINNNFEPEELLEDEMIEYYDKVLDNQNFKNIDLELKDYIHLCCNLMDIQFDPSNVSDCIYEIFAVYEYIKNELGFQAQKL